MFFSVYNPSQSFQVMIMICVKPGNSGPFSSGDESELERNRPQNLKKKPVH